MSLLRATVKVFGRHHRLILSNLRRAEPVSFAISRCAYSTDMQKQFEDAKERLNSLTDDPGNDVKLELYALFKQATSGQCNTKEPGMFDFVAKAKWQAWNGLGSITQDEAQKKYVDLVNKLAGSAPAAASQGAKPEPTTGGNALGLDVTNEGGLLQIKLNRVSKKNAITWEMYKAITKILNDAANDATIKIAVLTGTGDYYSSGNDLSNFTNVKPDQMSAMAEDGRITLKGFVASFIDFPKPLIAAVNGPAVGIPVTTLGLCDLVYCADTATFHTPFMNLGQSPEGCSSYLFPKIMGYAKANDVLLRGRKFTAQEALDWGLVSEVFPKDSFEKTVQMRISEMVKMPPKSLMYSKALMRETEAAKLHEVNDMECTRLRERWTSDECIAAIMNFFQRKSKV